MVRIALLGLVLMSLAACGQIGIDALPAPDSSTSDAAADVPPFDAGERTDARSLDGGASTDARGSDAGSDAGETRDAFTRDVPAGIDAGPNECSTFEDCPMPTSICQVAECPAGECLVRALNEGMTCPSDDISVLSTCIAGACTATGCVASRGNCDGDFSNGCETGLGTASHCGACDDSCHILCGGASCDEVVGMAFVFGGRDICAVLASGRVACVEEGSRQFAITDEYPRLKVLDDQIFYCFVDADDIAWCADSSNSQGQLGDGTMTPSVPPVQVAVPSAARQVSVDVSHACALLVGGEVFCWGGNVFGQLGQGTREAFIATPVQVPGLSNIVAIRAGNTHTFARTAGGEIYSWGVSSRIGRSGDPDSPGLVEGVTSAVQVQTGFGHACAQLADGTLQCWGLNNDGQAGGGDTGVPTARTVALPGPATDVAAGDYHTCAVVGGRVLCFGRNGSGELGDGTTTNSSTPNPVPGLSDVERVFASGLSTCALTTSGEVFCWGVGLGPNPLQIAAAE